MSKYYISSTVGLSNVGTVDDINDPYGIQYVLSNSNTAGVSAGDEIIVLVDGTYLITLSLYVPIAGSKTAPIIIRAGDASTGNPVLTFADIDCTGLSFANGLNIGRSFNTFIGFDFHSGPSRGVLITSGGDTTTLINVKSRNHATQGIEIDDDATACLLAYCQATGNSDYGFYVFGDTFLDRPTIYKCYAKDNTDDQFYLGGDLFNNGFVNALDCIGILDATNHTANHSIFKNEKCHATYLNNTARLINGPSNNAFAINGIESISGDLIAAISNQFDGLVNSGAGAGTGILITGGTAEIAGGNGYSDSDTAKTGTFTTDFDTILNTTDPAFPDDTDHTPGTRIAGLIENISGETDWINTGAVQTGNGSGGGGNSLIIVDGSSPSETELVVVDAERL